MGPCLLNSVLHQCTLSFYDPGGISKCINVLLVSLTLEVSVSASWTLCPATGLPGYLPLTSRADENSGC